MSNSKGLGLPTDSIDIKVHYIYHGGERCGLVDMQFNDLYSMNYEEFGQFLREEIVQLKRLNVLRISFLDDEKTYIDLSPRNFHRFIKLATHSFQTDTPKINIKVSEGSSPMPVNDKPVQPSDKISCKRLFDVDELTTVVPYKSPIEIDINVKQRELDIKKRHFEEVTKEYETLWREYNVPPSVFDSSKSVCARCHLRMGHTKNRCQMQPCESAGMCGIVDRHPDEKKQLSELGKKKQKLDGEIKAITSDLKIKEKISKDHNQSFESKIHDILIKTNPQKYLTVNRRPKEGIILADTYVIKKYYGGKNPTKDALENDSDIFQTIIESHESKIGTTTPKNSVMKQLEDLGIQWPRQAAASSVSAFGFPQNYMNWQMAPVLPPGYVGPIASPPPPYAMEPYQPPLPQTADDGTERPPLPAEEMP